MTTPHPYNLGPRSPDSGRKPAAKARRHSLAPTCEALEDRRLLSVSAVAGKAFSVKAFSVNEGDGTTALTLATFTATGASYAASVDWGDGTTSSGTVGGSGGSFTVTGQHAYAEEGELQVNVTITGSTDIAYAVATADVADAPLHVLAQAVNAVPGQAVQNVTVATFTDDDPAGILSDYTATVNWGDGTPGNPDISPGTISGPGAGDTFTITASKAAPYAVEGVSLLTVTVSDGGGTPRAANTWAKVANLPSLLSFLVAATGSDGRIYAFGGVYYRGGFTDPEYNSEVDAYNPATNTWTKVADLPSARDALAAATGADGRIYAIGGQNSYRGIIGGISSEVDAYNTATNTWTQVASLPSPRDGLAAVTGPDGRIYAIGGYGNNGVISEVDAYDPATNAWTQVASLPSPRAGSSAATGPDGRIYAIGGYGNNGVVISEVDAYDPATNAWTQVASLPSPRYYLAAVTGPDGRIYAIGGYDNNNGVISEVDAYNPATNTWTTVASLPNPRPGFAESIGSDGRIYAIAGQNIQPGELVNQNEVDVYTAVGPSTAVNSVSITVAPPPPVAVSDAYTAHKNGALNVSTAIGVLANDIPAGQVTVDTSKTTQPLNGTVTLNADGSFVYNPKTGFTGTDTFTYFAQIGMVDSTTPATVTITVINDTSVAQSATTSLSHHSTTGVDITLTATDADGDALTYTLVGADGGAMDGRVTLSGNVAHYTPTGTTIGTDSFQWQANAGTADSNIAIEMVNLTNTAPVVTSPSYGVVENTPLPVVAPGVLMGATDADGDPLTAVLVSQPTQGTVTLNPDGSFTYTPQNNFSGTDSFTFQAGDGTANSNTGTVAIAVALVSAPLPMPATVVGSLAPVGSIGSVNGTAVTDDNTPTFSGTAPAGYVVLLFAQQNGQSAPSQVGQTTVQSDGTWSAATNTLPDGTYAFSATSFDPNNQANTTGSAWLGGAVIETSGPKVANVTFDAKHGRIDITYQDSVGLNLANLLNAAEYTVTQGNKTLHPTRMTAKIGNGTTSETIELTFARGKKLNPTRYLLNINSSLVQNSAGENLDGKFNGVMPSGNGSPGSQFQAGFTVKSNHSVKGLVPVVIGLKHPKNAKVRAFSTIQHSGKLSVAHASFLGGMKQKVAPSDYP